MIFNNYTLREMNRTKPFVKVKGIDGWLQWDTCKIEEHVKPHAYHGQLTDMVNTQPLPLIFRAMPPQGHNGKGALYFIKNIYMKKPNESQ